MAGKAKRTQFFGVWFGAKAGAKLTIRLIPEFVDHLGQLSGNIGCCDDRIAVLPNAMHNWCSSARNQTRSLRRGSTEQNDIGPQQVVGLDWLFSFNVDHSPPRHMGIGCISRVQTIRWCAIELPCFLGFE